MLTDLLHHLSTHSTRGGSVSAPAHSADGEIHDSRVRVREILTSSSSMDQRSRAVVIGASMGGLIAARALADAFEQVTLVEMDELPHTPANRRGVPQGRHAHGLLGGGRQALDTLYPGFTAELVERGALAGDITGDVLWCNEGAYHRRFRSGLTVVVLSRPLIEHQVRARTTALPNVKIVQGTAVGLTVSEGAQRVNGVQAQLAERQAQVATLAADLVVDASGRG